MMTNKPNLNNCGCGGKGTYWTKGSLYNQGFISIFVRCTRCGIQTVTEKFIPLNRRDPVLDNHMVREGSDDSRAYEAAAKLWNNANP